MTARTDTEFGFIASGLSGAYLASSSGDQLGSRYFIGTANDLTATDFLVTSRRPQSDGSVQLELVEYIPQMYELDGANPPQPSVTLPNDINSVAASSIPDDAVSNLVVGLNGTVTATGGFSSTYVANPTAGIGVNFEARLTQESGDAIGGADLGVWLPLTADVTWTLTEDGAADGSKASVATLEIRDVTFTENIGRSTISMFSYRWRRGYASCHY